MGRNSNVPGKHAVHRGVVFQRCDDFGGTSERFTNPRCMELLQETLQLINATIVNKLGNRPLRQF